MLTTLVFWTLDIPPCLDSELSEFPLRMRDWLKNVLVTLYERDEDNNLLTEKQKLRVSSLASACPRVASRPERDGSWAWAGRHPQSPSPRTGPPGASLPPCCDERLGPGR